MKIGFIGGPKDLNSIETDNYPKEKVGFIFTHQVEKVGFQRDFDRPNTFEYKKLILQNNGELKYFYVLKDYQADELKDKIEGYWNLSEVIGYSLD